MCDPDGTSGGIGDEHERAIGAEAHHAEAGRVRNQAVALAGESWAIDAMHGIAVYLLAERDAVEFHRGCNLPGGGGAVGSGNAHVQPAARRYGVDESGHGREVAKPPHLPAHPQRDQFVRIAGVARRRGIARLA